MTIEEKKVRWWSETDPEKNIKLGIGVGIVQGSFMLLLAIAFMYSPGSNFLSYDASIVVDLAWIAMCVWFLYYAKSRTAAIMLFARHVIGLFAVLSSGRIVPVIVGGLIALAYWKAIEGTYAIRKKSKTNTEEKV